MRVRQITQEKKGKEDKNNNIKKNMYIDICLFFMYKLNILWHISDDKGSVHKLYVGAHKLLEVVRKNLK